MRTAAVTGIAGALGRAVALRLADHPDVERVVGIDRVPVADPIDGVDTHVVDIAAAEMKPVLEGVDVLVHLAYEHAGDDRTARANVDGTRSLLETAGAVDVSGLVVLSSACAYGAWSGNPLPLTEEAPLRPNPELALAVERAEIERLAAEWRTDHPNASVAVLRPAIVVADGGATWLGRVLWNASLLLKGDDAPPVQYVHLDDLTSAVALVATAGLDGAYNVAPDGWLEAEQVRALAGARPRVPLPTRAWRRVTGIGRELGLTDLPEGVEALLRHRWVVSNDRLKAAGWEPSHTNEQAFVAAYEGSPWTEMSPKRRQELALGVMGVVLAGAGAAAVGAVRRWRR